MLTIEKIEGKRIVIDNGSFRFEADISEFEEDVREGDVVLRSSGGKYRCDKALTEKRKKEILDLQNDLWK